MNFKIIYECRSEGNVFYGDFTLNSDKHPEIHEKEIIELALKDSIKFHQSGLAGITIKSISQI